MREAAWPLIRADLDLSYAQVGVLLGAPRVVSGLIEPLLGILGDTRRRRALILGGGITFALSLAVTGLGRTYGALLFSFILFHPASGAFVSLSQASLMDSAPEDRERNMARWTFAGSLGVVAGPIALGLATAVSLGWRSLYLVAASLAVLLVVAARASDSLRGPSGEGQNGAPTAYSGLAGAVRVLKRGEVLRWLALLQFSDLMLDVLLGFLALYLVDVGHVSSAQAAVAVAAWSGAGLVGDYLIIHLLRIVDSLTYLRISAAAELVLFAGFLLVPSFVLRGVLLALLGLMNAGWYSILKARLYGAMPGQSGTAMAVSNLAGLVGAAVTLGLGWVAQRAGLGATMWVLTAGPLALLVGLPAGERRGAQPTP